MAGKAWRAGLWGPDTVQTGTFWVVLNVFLFASCAQLGGALTDLLEEVMIFGVSWGVPLPTDHREEMMIFGVPRGASTDPLEEVMIFGVSWLLLCGNKQKHHKHKFFVIHGHYR